VAAAAVDDGSLRGHEDPLAGEEKEARDSALAVDC
jgi:hypothetical protein